MGDRALVGVVLFGSLMKMAICSCLVFLLARSPIVVQVSAFVAVTAILFVIAWVRYKMAAV